MAVAINTKTLVFDSEILDLVAELDEFKGAWRALSTLAPDRLSALRRVATIESIGSSTRIEGNKLSDRDVECNVPLLLPPQMLLLMFAGWINRHQLDVIEYLLKERMGGRRHDDDRQTHYSDGA